MAAAGGLPPWVVTALWTAAGVAAIMFLVGMALWLGAVVWKVGRRRQLA
jgi:hypothetical protein